jgi:hypothetical protein
LILQFAGSSTREKNSSAHNSAPNEFMTTGQLEIEKEQLNCLITATSSFLDVVVHLIELWRD